MPEQPHWKTGIANIVVTERATTLRSYVVVTQDGNPIRRNRPHLVSLPQTVQQELPQKEEATPSSLPSRQYGYQDSKTPTDDVKTRSGRVVRPPIRHVLFCFDRCDVKESDLTSPLMKFSFARLIAAPN